MATNPYAPPAAPVSDPPEPEQAHPKPRQVRVAVALLWFVLVLDAATTVYFDYRRVSSPRDVILLTVLVSVVFAFAAFLNVKISQGRNWARWTFSAVVVFGLVPYLLPGDRNHVASALEDAASVTSDVLDLVVLYLLFSGSGALWFRFRADSRISG